MRVPTLAALAVSLLGVLPAAATAAETVPAPEAAPVEPTPVPEPSSPDTTEVEPAIDERVEEAVDQVFSSSIRRTSIVLHRVRRTRTVVVYGRVMGADSGRIKVLSRRVRPRASDGPARARIGARMAKTSAVRDNGSFRLRMRFRRDAKWRLRVIYVGTSDAYPARSRVLRFRT